MPDRLQKFTVYAVTFTVAACSILYELLIAQTVVRFVANIVVCYSVTIGLYLGSMGAGALACARWAGRRPVWAALFSVELALSAAGAAAVVAISFGHMAMAALLLAGHFVPGVILFYAVALAAVALIGILSGLELPLLLRLGEEVSPERRIANRVLAADYFGSLAGGLVFPLVMVPHFDLPVIGFFTALVNVTLALIIILLFVREERVLTLRFAGAFLLFAVLFVGLAFSPAVQKYFAGKYYFYPYSSRSPAAFFAPADVPGEVDRYRSPYQMIDLVRMPDYSDPFVEVLRDAYSPRVPRDPGFPRNVILYLNGDYQFWSDFEDVYHEFFADAPINRAGRVPRDVLVLGAGDGLLIRELVKYPEVKRIVHVELDPRMVELANTHPALLHLNGGALRDPRVQTVIGDAFHYLKRQRERFDAVYLDFPYANDFNTSKIYSREFYAFVRRALKPDGFAAMNAPGLADLQGSSRDQKGPVPSRLWPVYYSTLRAAGFTQVLPFFSRLDPDFPAARAILKPLIGDSPVRVTERDPFTGKSTRVITDQDQIIDELISDHVRNVTEGFIMMADHPLPAAPYRDRGIALDVFNARGYELAFAGDALFPRRFRRDRINSILRPTLPAGSSLWEIRLPY